MNFLIGFLAGIIVSTIGFTTVAGYLDQGVAAIKETTETVANK